MPRSPETTSRFPQLLRRFTPERPRTAEQRTVAPPTMDPLVMIEKVLQLAETHPDQSVTIRPITYVLDDEGTEFAHYLPLQFRPEHFPDLDKKPVKKQLDQLFLRPKPLLEQGDEQDVHTTPAPLLTPPKNPTLSQRLEQIFIKEDELGISSRLPLPALESLFRQPESLELKAIAPASDEVVALTQLGVMAGKKGWQAPRQAVTTLYTQHQEDWELRDPVFRKQHRNQSQGVRRFLPVPTPSFERATELITRSYQRRVKQENDALQLKKEGKLDVQLDWKQQVPLFAQVTHLAAQDAYAGRPEFQDDVHEKILQVKDRLDPRPFTVPPKPDTPLPTEQDLISGKHPLDSETTQRIQNQRQTALFREHIMQLRAATYDLPTQEQRLQQMYVHALNQLHAGTFTLEDMQSFFKTLPQLNKQPLEQLTHQQAAQLLSAQLEIMSRPAVNTVQLTPAERQVLQLAEQLNERGLYFFNSNYVQDHSTTAFHGTFALTDQGLQLDLCPDCTPLQSLTLQSVVSTPLSLPLQATMFPTPLGLSGFSSLSILGGLAQLSGLGGSGGDSASIEVARVRQAPAQKKAQTKSRVVTLLNVEKNTPPRTKARTQEVSAKPKKLENAPKKPAVKKVVSFPSQSSVKKESRNLTREQKPSPLVTVFSAQSSRPRIAIERPKSLGHEKKGSIRTSVQRVTAPVIEKVKPFALRKTTSKLARPPELLRPKPREKIEKVRLVHKVFERPVEKLIQKPVLKPETVERKKEVIAATPFRRSIIISPKGQEKRMVVIPSLSVTRKDVVVQPQRSIRRRSQQDAESRTQKVVRKTESSVTLHQRSKVSEVVTKKRFQQQEKKEVVKVKVEKKVANTVEKKAAETNQLQEQVRKKIEQTVQKKTENVVSQKKVNEKTQAVSKEVKTQQEANEEKVSTVEQLLSVPFFALFSLRTLVRGQTQFEQQQAVQIRQTTQSEKQESSADQAAFIAQLRKKSENSQGVGRGGKQSHHASDTVQASSALQRTTLRALPTTSTIDVSDSFNLARDIKMWIREAQMYPRLLEQYYAA